MTADDLLIMLAERVAAALGNSVLVGYDELATWPTSSVQVLTEHQLLRPAEPSNSIVCDQCEEACTRPVHTVPSVDQACDHFIVCDRRSDVHRIEVTSDRLAQWHISGSLIAQWLSRQLGLRPPNTPPPTAQRWELGLLKGGKYASHVLLVVDQQQLTLQLAGHTLRFADVLTCHDQQLTVDRRMLMQRVTKPVNAAGDSESATQREDRLKKRVAEEKNKGTRAFLKTVAEEEGISTSRLKQIINVKKNARRLTENTWRGKKLIPF